MKLAAVCISLLASFVLSAATAGAQSTTDTGSASAPSPADRATARALGMEGQDALARKDYVTAEDQFRRADELYPAPTLLLGYARAETALGKLVNASEAYNRIVREGVDPQSPQAFRDAFEAAKAEIDAVRSRIASVTITVTGPDAPAVTLDGQPFPSAALGVKRPIDPGDHVVQAAADGWQPAQTKFTVGEAGAAVASLALNRVAVSVAPPLAAQVAPTPSVSVPQQPARDEIGQVDSTTRAPGRGARTLGWIAIAAGGAGLATGTVAGLLALDQHSTLSKECSRGVCAPTYSNDVSRYDTLGAVATVGFIAGAVLAATGVVLVLTVPRENGPAVGRRLGPFVAFSTCGAFGAF